MDHPLMRRTSLIALFAEAGCLGILALTAGGCTTVDFDTAKARSRILPRWYTDEVAYEDSPFPEKVARSVRDGLIGLIDVLAQGAFAVVATANPTGSYMSQKVATMFGDLVGVIDDNELSEHIFKGILSRQFLKYGSSARNYPKTLGAIHGISITGEEHTIADYTRDKSFHTEVYGRPSVLTTLGGIVLADFLIRPAANLVKLVGLRKTSEKIDNAGLTVIEASAGVNFF